MAEKFGDDERVKLFTVSNAGKAAALNTGLRHARGEIVIALDADTLFAPQTVGALAHSFTTSWARLRGMRRSAIV